jgi:hypothetical protein
MAALQAHALPAAVLHSICMNYHESLHALCAVAFKPIRFKHWIFVELRCDNAAWLCLQFCCVLRPTCGGSAPAFVELLQLAAACAQLLVLQCYACVWGLFLQSCGAPGLEPLHAAGLRLHV